VPVGTIAQKHSLAMEKKTFIDLIGNTPMVYLRRASEDTGCTILVKA